MPRSHDGTASAIGMNADRSCTEKARLGGCLLECSRGAAARSRGAEAMKTILLLDDDPMSLKCFVQRAIDHLVRRKEEYDCGTDRRK